MALNQVLATDVLQELNVPVLKMIHAARQTEAEWLADPQGLNLPQVIISITLPEFDGLIEPILVSVAEDGRLNRLCRRCGAWWTGFYVGWNCGI